MQYIHKSPEPPVQWDDWFKKVDGIRSFDYASDYKVLHNLRLVKDHLLDEQHGLCAYCQKQLNANNSSIEHLVPKSFNVVLSTNYHNLVAVCKNPKNDLDEKKHCDKERGNKLLVNIVLHNNATVTLLTNHPYFDAYKDGSVVAKNNLPTEIKNQVESFLNILNLKYHNSVKTERKRLLDNILSEFSKLDNREKKGYLQFQFNRILKDNSMEYRQFILINIAKLLGIN